LVLFDKYPLFTVTGKEDDDEDGAPVVFIAVDIVASSVEIDLLAIGDVINGIRHRFSCIGVFVLALAV
jgi:hypothetical protein